MDKIKFKLIDVETNRHDAEVGSCEFCMSVQTIDEPVYVIEIDGVEKRINGYSWSWGHYEEYTVHNVIEFAAYLAEHEFQSEDDITPEQLFYRVLNDYSWYKEDEQYEVE